MAVFKVNQVYGFSPTDEKFFTQTENDEQRKVFREANLPSRERQNDAPVESSEYRRPMNFRLLATEIARREREGIVSFDGLVPPPDISQKTARSKIRETRDNFLGTIRDKNQKS